MIRIRSFLKCEIDLLFYGTPIIYAVSKVIGNQNLYAAKDVWMAFLCLQIVIVFISRRISVVSKNALLIFVFFAYIVINSLFQMEDSYFWLISLREMVVTPLMLIVIGMYLNYLDIDYLNHSRKALYFTCILTVLFSFVFRSLSFGATERLSSFWDREHEPAIIGALLIVSTIAYYMRENDTIHLKDIALPVLFGGYCVILSRSRSGILALFFALVYIFADKLKVRNIIALVVLGIGGYLSIEYYTAITHRALNYNIGARLSQYSMAYELIKTHPIFGIGTDKYGVLGMRTKVFTYKGLSTITMDSDLIKYLVNLGLLFLLFFILLIKETYKCLKYKDRYAFVFIVFGLAIGAVTGKLGSYPMNQYFYPLIGYIVLNRNIYGLANDGLSIEH